MMIIIGIIILGLLCTGIVTPSMPYPIKVALVHHFGHAIKIDQQTEKDLVGGGAVFMDASQIAENRNPRYILAMKG